MHSWGLNYSTHNRLCLCRTCHSSRSMCKSPKIIVTCVRFLKNRWRRFLLLFSLHKYDILEERCSSLLIRSGCCWFFICCRNYWSSNEELVRDCWFGWFWELNHRKLHRSEMSICKYLLSLTGIVVPGLKRVFATDCDLTRADKIPQH